MFVGVTVGRWPFGPARPSVSCFRRITSRVSKNAAAGLRWGDAVALFTSVISVPACAWLMSRRTNNLWKIENEKLGSELAFPGRVGVCGSPSEQCQIYTDSSALNERHFSLTDSHGDSDDRLAITEIGEKPYKIGVYGCYFTKTTNRINEMTHNCIANSNETNNTQTT